MDHRGEGSGSLTLHVQNDACPEGDDNDGNSHVETRYQKARATTRIFLESKAKHWVILTLIILDIAGILSDIIIALITCELHQRNEKWVEPTRSALLTFSLVMSCLFLAELILSIWAEGLEFFCSWLHCFDAFVIIGSFVIDLLEHNVAEEIASLVVVLRLWRFVKIINEFSVEANEQIQQMNKRCEDLEKENEALRAQLGRPKQYDEEAATSS